MDVARWRSPFARAGLLLGFGLGGLADGIVLHQVLQWHNLATNRIDPTTIEGLRANVFWDGMFHLAVTTLVVVAVLMLWTASRRTHAAGDRRALVALALMGWGAFHVVDQLVFHLLLRLHDIRPDAAEPQLYNWGFFCVGLLLTAGGWALQRARPGTVSPRP